MSSIDERVARLQFDNAQFSRGIKTTLDQLAALNKGLKLEGATKGLSDVSSAASKLHLAGIADSVQNIASKFSALGVIGVAALANIANRAVSAGLALAKSITVAPIMDGLREYETQLNSIQTILANTGLTGQAGLDKVNTALTALNKYSDQTIYNFGEMARNIGTFTAAGVKLDVSVNAIKGIANLAAISGSNSQQASTAMYQLSQALATGTVKLIDWNSVVNAGMGGKVFQESLKETARAHGVAVDQIIKDEGSFRDSLQTGWLTSEVLTETLSKFTGDLNAQQLKTMGYTDKQIAGIIQLGKTAKDAATKVKTMSQLIGTLQEAAGSGWSKTWQILFGDFEEARTLFTNVNNVLGGFINASADARNKVLEDWKALGGRTALIDSIANAFHALISVLRPIRDAFRQIFPAATGQQLYNLTVAIRDFTAGLKIGADTSDKLKRTFAGIFAVFDIGVEIIKQVVKTFFSLFSTAAQGSGSILDVTAKIGDFLVSLRDAIVNGEGLSKFFSGLGKVLAIPIKLIGKFAELISKAFDGIANVDTSGLDRVQDRFAPLGRLGELISAVWSNAARVFKAAWTAFQPIADKMADAFGGIGDALVSSFSSGNFSTVLDAVNTGLFAGLILLVKRFMGNLLKIDPSGGIIDSIKGAFDTLTGTMKTMQASIRAKTLLQIAAAIALLTVSVVALSLIDSEKLTKSLTAMAVMFSQLMATMAIFTRVSGAAGFVKVPVIAASLILLAIAVDALTIAVIRLSKLDWNGLAKGLIGVTVLIGLLVGATKGLAGNAGGMIATGAGLILLAAGIKILASAVTDLSGLSWEEMAKGLIGVGGLLAALVLFTKFAAADKAGIIQGAGIVLLVAGIKILASAMKDMASLSWGEIAKGLVATGGGLLLIAAALNAIPPTALLSAAGVLIVAASLGMIGDALKKMGGMKWGEIAKGLVSLAGALTLIALALTLIPPTSLLSAAAIFVVAASLGMITTALGTMGGMSWGEIAKGLVTLAGALTIIAVAVTAMTSALPGAAALLVVAASLRILTPVLTALGEMSWGEIAKGLLTLAGVFLVLGVAGLVLGPLVPVLIGLGIAVTLLGVGMLAAGAGVLAFSIGLTALSVAGAAGAAAIVSIVKSLIGLIPLVMQQIGLGIVAFAKVIATAGPAITKAITTVLLALIKAIDTLSPKIIATLARLMMNMLNTMVTYVPRMVDAGLKILIGFLQGVANNIGRVVTVATNVIVNFINGISRNLPRIVDSGVKLIIAFINGVSRAIDSNSAALGAAGGRLGVAIVKGIVRGIASGAGEIAGAARRAAGNALSAAKGLLGIHSPSTAFAEVGKFSALGMANGLDKFSGVVADSASGIGRDAIFALSKSITGMSGLISDNIDANPTISPVLDLSNVKKSAGKIDDILQTKPFVISGALAMANDAAVQHGANQAAAASNITTTTETVNNFEFVQNNTSPKALTSAEIYRQTKNQLSVVKGAVGK